MARAAYRCPRCNHQLAWHQVARHTWWSPIVCRGCRARIHYDGKQWFSAGWPLVVGILVLNGLAFLGPKLFDTGMLLYLFTTIGAVFVLAFARWTWLILIRPKMIDSDKP